MKIAVTGGHFSPAYAFIKKFHDQHDFLIIGRKHTFEGDAGESFEYRVAQQEKIPFYVLKTARLQRKLSPHTVPSLLKFPIGITSAMHILQKTKPDIVLSFGGYLSVPVALAAKVLGIPVIIHEQTQGAGLSNKVVGKFAKRVLVSFASSSSYFPKNKTVLTGNPLRDDIFSIQKTLGVPPGLPIIYVTGGSGGSHFINQVVGEIISQLVEKYVVIHQTGDSQEFNDYDQLVRLRDGLPKEIQNRYLVTKFVFPDQIGWVLQNANLLIARAGMNTVYEIMALKKMALLIPLPYGQNNEQLRNAQLIKKIGLGTYITQSDCSPEQLLQTIQTMFKNSQEYEVKSITNEYFQPDAIKNIEHEIQLVYAQKTKKK